MQQVGRGCLNILRYSKFVIAEHVTAVTVSVKDKLTLSLGVAVGSSIVSSGVVISRSELMQAVQQIALFVIP